MSVQSSQLDIEQYLKHYFEYHPIKTEERQGAHNAINDAARALARAVLVHVKNPDCVKMSLFAIQQARMFANQGATIDEVISGRVVEARAWLKDAIQRDDE